MCSINWTKSRGHILFYKILSKRSPWALKDEEPCLFYCKDTPNSLGGMRLLWQFTIKPKYIQSTLGFETLDKAAALGLETATPLTDPRQYINSNLGFRNLKI